MRFFCVLFLSLCFLLSSTNVQANDALVTEFTPIPQRKKEVVEQFFIRQVIEMREIDEDAPVPRRKQSLDKELESITKPREAKNEVESEEGKVDELVIAEIIDSIRDKLTKCWSIPESLAHKENFNIKINLLLSNQGEIVMADIVDSSSYKDDPFFRSIADSAMRAVYKCNPLTSLPAKHYHIWREVRLDFILNG